MPRSKSWTPQQARQFASINKSIATKVSNALSRAMKGELEETAKSIMQSKVQDDVYSYTPLEYERRGVNGGLADEKNIQILKNEVSVSSRKSSNRIFEEDHNGELFYRPKPVMGRYINTDYSAIGEFSFANITPPNNSVFGTPIDYTSDPTILSCWINDEKVPDLNNMTKKFRGHPKHFLEDTFNEFYVSGLAKTIIVKGLKKEIKK